jgi:hypothetical protein
VKSIITSSTVDLSRKVNDPRTGTPWGFNLLRQDGSRIRIFDGSGNAWYDIEIPGDHSSGPAYHMWNNGIRSREIPF